MPASPPRTATPPPCSRGTRRSRSAWTPRRRARLLLTEVDAALAARGVDAVLGPATDGGWWALGLRDPSAAALVACVPTSRADTGHRTLHALRAGGLRVALLPELTDVDTMTDALGVAAAAPGTRFAAAVRALPPRATEPRLAPPGAGPRLVGTAG